MTDSARIPRTHRVILVRHAQSLVDQTRHPAEWHLAGEGRAAARRLAALGLFDQVAGFYAGPEPKLVHTLAPVAEARGQQVAPEPDFAETRSEGWLDADAFLATVRRFFAAPDRPPARGWESASAAAGRFAAGVERLQARHGPAIYRGHALPGTFAIATGGRMLAAYLAGLFHYTPEQAFDFWRRLRFPDLAVIELSATAPPRLVIPFGTLA
jgi:broad specificity phosphatase PhoE